jgi:uncharacterized protein YbjT (DUF2867 family)
VRVLVTGAGGFIGRQVAAALVAAGHRVAAGVRTPTRHHPRPDDDGIACDFARDHTPETWLGRLVGIDAVVNCVGVLRERGADTFQHVHVDAPRALAEACVRSGIRRFVQVSALGDPADGEFIASKHRGDEALRALDLDLVIVRPSVVYSTRGSYGGTSLLRAMAAVPGVMLLPGRGQQPLDPLSGEDLGQLVLRLLEDGTASRETVEAVGPGTLTLEKYLLAWRAWLGLGAPRLVLRVPAPLVAAAAALGERFGSGPLGRTMHAMLARGNVGSAGAAQRMARLLGRAPRSLDQALRAQPSFVQDRWQARLHLAEPVLRLSIAFVWLFSGVVGFRTPAAEIVATLDAAGVSQGALPLVYGASALDGALGVLLALRWRVPLVGAAMIASVLAYTLFIGVRLPGSWWDPFGGLLKNLVVLPALWVMIAMSDRR